MKINQELINLFKPTFNTDIFDTQQKVEKFTCSCMSESECNVDVTKEPIWSPALGDENTKVMLIAEAPSASGGLGPHIGGQFQNIGNENLLRFVKKYYDTIPYFTDLMKCGVNKQLKEQKSKVFKNRKKNCFKKFLIEEIKIIKPEVILCLGWASYNAVMDELNKEDSRINKSTKVFKLLHYGRQANLQLTLKDKEEIIWPIQIKQMAKENLKNLSKFQEIVENENEEVQENV